MGIEVKEIKIREPASPSSGDKYCSHCDEKFADVDYFNEEYKEWWGICRGCLEELKDEGR